MNNISNSTDEGLHILTVSELTHAIKNCLEKNFFQVSLQGEISNLKRQASGHLYFSLKDAQAQISVVMFRNQASALKVMPKDGDKVIISGEMNVYPPSGRYQVIARELSFAGMGALLLKYEELKKKLLSRGWFDPALKKPLPKFPKKIGVVTSPTGAAIQDILKVLSRRFAGFELILNPVRVQGEGAASEIAKAIEQFNDYNLVDVLIVGRGGGSIEDLWCFNEEVVAEAIFNSKIPIISAVGHETDVCLSDFVADVRAPTPSFAASLVIAEKDHQIQHLTALEARISQIVATHVRHNKEKLVRLKKQPMVSSPYALLGLWMQKLDSFKVAIESAMKRLLLREKTKLSSTKQHLFALKPMVKITHLKKQIEQWELIFRKVMTLKVNQKKQAFAAIRQNHLLFWQKLQDVRRKGFSAETARKQIDYSLKRTLFSLKERLRQLDLNLKSIDPKNLLNKGYAILFKENENAVITSTKTLAPSDSIRIILGDGKLVATVKEISSHDKT